MLAALFCAGISAGCKKNPAPFCPGGFVRADAGSAPVCEGLCQPSLCKDTGDTCVGNACLLQCTSDSDCSLGQDCAPATEDGTGKSVTVCRSNGKGKIGTACPTGTECANVMTCGDGSACPATGNCTTGTCQALSCVTAGAGDALAYCTLFDCHGDTDCPGGYWCKTSRVADQICGQPVPPSVCGTTSAPCVDPAKNAANGTTFASGNVCTQRSECRVRGPCDPCTTDLDCSLGEGLRCVQGGCASDCASDADCLNGFQCTSGSCVPRFGKCAAPTGTGGFCDPCRIESDCGPNLFCGLIEANGLRACLPLVGMMACNTSTDCPTTATGLHASCQNGICVNVPVNSVTNAPGCWCQNKGAGCGVATDCCSGACDGANPNAGTSGVCQ